MRTIGIQEIEDIALGAALLGAGGGGDPYVGKLVAMGAVKECGPVTLLDPEEVPDDALLVPIAMMGAPTVLGEKGIGGGEYQTLYNMVSQFFGKKIYAFMPIEAGGVNSMLPIAACARLGLPLVDCDGMGRAFPELQMVTFTIGGMSATPMALTDEKGNSVIFDHHQQVDGRTGSRRHHELRRFRVCLPVPHDRSADEGLFRQEYRHPQPEAGRGHPHGEELCR